MRLLISANMQPNLENLWLVEFYLVIGFHLPMNENQIWLRSSSLLIVKLLASVTETIPSLEV